MRVLYEYLIHKKLQAHITLPYGEDIMTSKYFIKLISMSFITTIFLCSCQHEQDVVKISNETLPVPQIEYNPNTYVCYQIEQQLKVDGKMSEEMWKKAAWTEYFVDIEGNQKPIPRYKTRVKMLWDSDYFYFAAEMEEPHIWAKLTERDAVIYHDNDFEIFIDPDGDTHEYYELEINAFRTEWDLLLVRPYRDGAPAVNAWDIQGLRTAIDINGTINDPSDTDSSWTVEIAIPWEVLAECAHKSSPPNEGDQWRVNFSRVQWQTDIINGEYIKKKDSVSGNNLPENNWVWSPQGLIAMHYPEMWGFVQFSTSFAGSEEVSYSHNPIEDAKHALRLLYYSERTYQMQYGTYTNKINLLKLQPITSPHFNWHPKITIGQNQFEAQIIMNTGEHIFIDHEGKIKIVK